MASNLTTKTLVKAYLDINVTSFDDVIDTIVDGVNQAVENYLDLIFAQTTYTDEEYDQLEGSRILTLKHSPVISFTRLQYKNSPSDYDSTDWTSFATSEYKVDTNGVITKNSNFAKGKKRYRATYVAGYASIPDDIKLAATKIAASMYENRKGSGVTSETLGEYSRTFATDRATWKNLDIDWILNKYKNTGATWFGSAYEPERVPVEFKAD